MISRRNASLPVRAVRVFDPQDGEVGRRVGSLERNHIDVARQLDIRKNDKPIPTEVLTANATAAFGDYLRVDPSRGGFSITLPAPQPKDAGKHIWFVNITSSANAITLRPVPPAQIGGGATASIAGAGATATIITDGKDYRIH